MPAKQHLQQLRQRLERLRQDSLGLVDSANRIVYKGVQQLADRELKALDDYYRAALKSIKSANRSDLRGLAQQQLDLLQDTVDQVISHARESMSIVAETRAELARLVDKSVRGRKVAAADLGKAAAPARKAVSAARKAAVKAGKEAGRSARKAGAKARSGARKAAAEGGRGAAAAAKALRQAVPRPSANSRAGRATSAAKRAVSPALDSVGSVVSGVSESVSGIVGTVADAIKKRG